MKPRQSMLGVFAALLSSLGGSMPIIAPDPNRKRHTDGKGFGPNARALNSKNYWFDAHGSARRRIAKRDHSISARQWKKRLKGARREAKAVQS